MQLSSKPRDGELDSFDYSARVVHIRPMSLNIVYIRVVDEPWFARCYPSSGQAPKLMTKRRLRVVVPGS